MTGGGYTKTEAWNLQLQAKVDTLDKRVAELEKDLANTEAARKRAIKYGSEGHARAEQAESENEGLHKLVDHYSAVAKAAEEAHKHWPFLVAQPPAGFWGDMEKLWAAVQAHRETS